MWITISLLQLALSKYLSIPIEIGSYVTKNIFSFKWLVPSQTELVTESKSKFHTKNIYFLNGFLRLSTFIYFP